MEVLYEYNGTPHLVMVAEDLAGLPENITNVPPPQGIYQPYHFDDTQGIWIGASKEEFEASLPAIEVIPDSKDLLIEELTNQLEEQKYQIDDLTSKFESLSQKFEGLQV